MSVRGSLFAALLFALFAHLAPPALASIHHPGKWSASTRWRKGTGPDSLYRETAVNMAVIALPDSLGQTRARVLWWQDDHDHDPAAPPDTSFGGFVDWRPASDTLLNSGAFPDTSGTGTFRMRRYPTPGYNIFCSGMTPLDEDQGYGRLLVAGGTIEAENGSPEATVYSARTNTWTRAANRMAVGRWYPTATRLASGKVLITSGSRYGQVWLFGGGGNSADSNFYFSPISHEAAVMWNETKLPLRQPDPSIAETHPVPRRGHSAVWQIGGMLAMYGGRRLDDGQFLSDCWMLRPGDNPDAVDYKYNYELRQPIDGGASPGPRADHTSQVLGLGTAERKTETLLLIGGQKAASGAGAVTSEVWAGRLINNTYRIAWKRLLPTASSETFPARFGHASVWEPSLKTLYVYGGTAEPGQPPSDRDVYALTFVGGDVDSVCDSTYVRWRKCTVQNPDSVPLARAFMAWDGITRHLKVSGTKTVDTRGLIFYGGRTSATTVSDSMFIVWPVDTTVVRWQRVPQTGTHPALEYASGTDVQNLQEFWVLGGKNAAGDTLAGLMTAALWCQDCGSDNLTANWVQRPAASHAVWGHTFPHTPSDVFARTSELYDPATNTITEVSGAYRREDWYPQTFTVPGQPGHAFVTGPQYDSWRLSLSGASGSWSTVSGTASGFRGGSAVMYRPGKILKCGSRDTDGKGTAIGTTRTIDITQASPTWASSDAMLPRVNHNLVVLPNGKVLVVGGTGTVENQDNQQPRKRPEIWDPDANGGAGDWEGADGVGTQLDESSVVRGYHSTAVLLPDGRVLCGGGNATDGDKSVGQSWKDDQFRMDLYSPSYLFNVNGTPATRPVVRSSPRRVSYGEKFIVGLQGAPALASMCLIAPGAVTHGYDENQRYVPLSYALTAPDSTTNRYYVVTTPSDSSIAPPGDYLLFVVNAGGTPSIARWVHVGRTNGSTGAPTTVADLHKQCSNGTSVTLLWTRPGTDAGSPVPAPVAAYDIRYKTGSMSNWSSFQAGTAVTAPNPGDPTSGSPDDVTITGLTANQTYYFRLAARNAASHDGNWSALSNEISFLIHDEECGGSGGGGGGGGYEEGASIRPVARSNSAFGRPGGSSVPDTAYLENTLLPNAPLNTTRTDRLRLPFGPRWTESGARVRLSRSGTRSTHFDRVRLLAADHAEGEGVFVRGGELVSGVTQDPVRVVHADGRDLTESFLAGGAFEGTDDDTLYVEFGDEGPGAFALSTSRAQLVRAPDRTGIDLACETAQGWVAVGHQDVRERSSDEAFGTPSLHRIRLVFRGVHRLDGIARLTPGRGVTVTAYDPIAAEHSRLGDAVADLAGNGSTLAAGDNLVADFAATPAPADTRRDWYLEVTGAHMEGGGGAQGARSSGPGTSLPTVFALARSRPNPFSGNATIGFDVPMRARVRMEVFDVLGRRVVVLTDRDYAPGRFSVTWDGRTSAGTLAHPGVYLCRLSAGAFHREQHLVLVR